MHPFYCTGIQLRMYNPKVNIEWVPPPKVSCLDPSKSGDRGALPELDLSRPQIQFTRKRTPAEFAEREE